jgi:hypothetical protein
MNTAANNDIAEIMNFCQVSHAQAQHYMSIFKSKNRSIAAHFDNANNPNWFATIPNNQQPTNNQPNNTDMNLLSSDSDNDLDDFDMSQQETDWQCDTCGQINDEGYQTCGQCNAVKIVNQKQPSAPSAPSAFQNRQSRTNNPSSFSSPTPSLSSSHFTIDDRKQETKDNFSGSMDDRTFYASYKNMVDTFCNQVIDGHDLATLRGTIQDADGYLNQISQSYSNSSTTNIPLRSDLANRICYRDDQNEGRTPLSYAAALNDENTVRNLIKLGADPCKVMPNQDGSQNTTTALTLAVMNETNDCTEMVRILLSLGSKPEEVDFVLTTKDLKRKYINRTMKYWLKTAKQVMRPDPVVLEQYRHLPPMDRLHEIQYAVVGQKPALSAIEEMLSARFANPQGNRKALVMLLLGPPGHGKTYLSRNMAKSLVGEENYLEIAMGSIRDDADLFGGNLGGYGGGFGGYASDGQLTSWLRARQGKNTIVFLDEFEKVKQLTSSLGHDQSKKIYQSFLEPWQEGVLTDQGKTGSASRSSSSNKSSGNSNKIDCSKTVWILTSNWGQDEIVQFASDHQDRVYRKMDAKDEAWLQMNLVKKILQPIVLKQFQGVHQELKALYSRIDKIVPFLPFTTREQKVVADTALRERENLYRLPAVLTGDPGQRRAIGNMHLTHTKEFGDHAANEYDPMQGARAMVAIAGQVDGKFNVQFGRGTLNITKEQRDRCLSTVAVDGQVPEPKIWIHYDEDTELISLHSSQPITNNQNDDGKDSDSEEEEEDDVQQQKAEEENNIDMDDNNNSWRKSGSFSSNGSNGSTRRQNPFGRK